MLPATGTRPIDYWRHHAAEALAWPPEGLLPATPLEQKCGSIPVIGRFIAYQFERRRMRRVARRFHAQVRLRPPVDPATWGDDPARRKFAAFLAEAIRDAGGWPNDHFLPSDPMSILCWEHDYGMEILLVYFAVEEEVGKAMAIEEFRRICSMSFAQAVDFLLATAKAR
jgi:hypothetical protein